MKVNVFLTPLHLLHCVVVWFSALSFQVAAQSRFTALTWITDGTSRIYSLSAKVTTGINHRLQTSTNLSANNWTEAGRASATGSVMTFSVTHTIAADPPYQFFRLVAESLPAVPADMALIPAGWFQMGDAFNEGLSHEGPMHSVFVSAFYMDRHEVTKALWDEVKRWSSGNGYGFELPGNGKAPNHPVQRVDWYDLVKWCNARSQKEGRVPAYYIDAALTQVYKTGQVAPYVNWAAGYRLPTEAEWEKAARGGASGRRFPWSDSDTITHGRENYFSDSRYSYDVSPTRRYHPTYLVGEYPYTSPVGSFAPNGYGLYDMAGNVWEWCWDWYDTYPSGSSTDPRGPASGSRRVFRGASGGDFAFNCRSAYRYYGDPFGRSSFGGFRSVLSP